MKIETARFMRAAHRAGDFLTDGLPEIAFAGRSNVGKSTLLNRLLGRKSLARMSSSPGRTRAINYYLINSKFYFVDLPGYGYAKVGRRERQRWAELIDRYLRRSAERGRVVQLVDAKVGATPLDLQAIHYLRDLGIRPTVVATKIDRVPRARQQARIKEVGRALEMEPGDEPLPLSARTGAGIGNLWRELSTFLGRTGGDAN